MLCPQEDTAVRPTRASQPVRRLAPPAPPMPAPDNQSGADQTPPEARGDIWWLIALCLLFLLGTSPAWVLMYFWVEI